jgi:hypothetical protein
VAGYSVVNGGIIGLTDMPPISGLAVSGSVIGFGCGRLRGAGRGALRAAFAGRRLAARFIVLLPARLPPRFPPRLPARFVARFAALLRPPLRADFLALPLRFFAMVAVPPEG